MPESAETRAEPQTPRRAPLAAVLLVLLGGGAVAWLALRSDDGDGSGATGPTGAATASPEFGASAFLPRESRRPSAPGSREPATPEPTEPATTRPKRPPPGAASDAAPVDVSFELLKSVFGKVDERSDRADDIPPEIAELDGKKVRIRGFLGLPYMAEGEIEMIFIYERPYNGCCIGMPPDFFDSVEVARRDGGMIKLAEDFEYHYRDFEIEVTASGTFRVKKILDDGALLQMYFLDADEVGIDWESVGE